MIPDILVLAKLKAAIVAATLLALSPAPSPPRPRPVPIREVRETVLLAEGWRFRQADSVQGAEQPGFEDSSWAVVSCAAHVEPCGPLPRRIPPADVNRAETIDKTQGVGWYRLTLHAAGRLQGEAGLARVRRRQPCGEGLAQRDAPRRAQGRLLAIPARRHRGAYGRARPTCSR